MASDEYQSILKAVKQSLFTRDYMSVFLNSALYLAVYSMEYVPTRALCYHHLFVHGCPIIREVIMGRHKVKQMELLRRRASRKLAAKADSVPISYQSNSTNILCVGAGAGSELVALIKTIYSDPVSSLFIEDSSKLTWSDFERQVDHSAASSVNLHLYDIADWSQLLHALSKPIDTLILSKQWGDRKCSTKFHQLDVLSEDAMMPTSPFYSELSTSDLVTFMFVLNELFSVSKSKTVNLLTQMVRQIALGSCILVVESAGSISEIQVGKQNLMLYNLLDRISCLKTVVSEDAMWYRPPPTLHHAFPSKLTNMRYFVRLYEKTSMLPTHSQPF